MAKQLQPRERMFIFGGIAAAILIGVWWGAQRPLDAYRKSALTREATRLRLQQAQLWHDEIKLAQDKVDQIKQSISNRGFDLWTHIDSVVKILALGQRADIRSVKGVASPTDKVSAVQMQLTGVSLQELVDLLYKIYSSDYIIILDRVDQIKPSQNGHGLDCRMVFLAPKL